MDRINNQSRPIVLYLSHGAGPMPILGDDEHKDMVDNLKMIAAKISKPSAIILISAHWEEAMPTITRASNPPLSGLEYENLLVIGSGFSFHNMSAFFAPRTAEMEMMNEAFTRWLNDTCSNPRLGENDVYQVRIQLGQKCSPPIFQTKRPALSEKQAPDRSGLSMPADQALGVYFLDLFRIKTRALTLRPLLPSMGEGELTPDGYVG